MPNPIDQSALAGLMESDIPHAVLDVRPREDFVAAQIFGSITCHARNSKSGSLPSSPCGGSRRSSSERAAPTAAMPPA